MATNNAKNTSSPTPDSPKSRGKSRKPKASAPPYTEEMKERLRIQVRRVQRQIAEAGGYFPWSTYEDCMKRHLRLIDEAKQQARKEQQATAKQQAETAADAAHKQAMEEKNVIPLRRNYDDYPAWVKEYRGIE